MQQQAPQESVSPFNKLSDEVLLDILLRLPYERILAWCKTNRRAAQFCRDSSDALYRALLRRNFAADDLPTYSARWVYKLARVGLPLLPKQILERLLVLNASPSIIAEFLADPAFAPMLNPSRVLIHVLEGPFSPGVTSATLAAFIRGMQPQQINRERGEFRGRTALMIAVNNPQWSTSPQVWQAILAKQPAEDINIRDEVGATALVYAASCRNNERRHREQAVLDIMDVPGIDVNLSKFDTGDTPLTAAIFTKLREEVLLRMLQLGADVNAATYLGRTPLMHALRVRRPTPVGFLLAALADHRHPDVTLTDDKGRTLMHYAMVHDAPEPVIQRIAELERRQRGRHNSSDGNSRVAIM